MKDLIKVVIAAVVFTSCSTHEANWKPKAQNPEYLHRTLKQITDVIVHDIFSPPVAARIYAYS
ncbi:MAG: phosphatidic acid phosphatase, partial [Bacteroidota bacterium]|nr:phosphatidic acid phosphatase [Bacteroidota bacterium]